MDINGKRQAPKKYEKEISQDKSFSNSPKSSSTTDFPTIPSNFQDEIIEEFDQSNEGLQHFFPQKSLHSQQNILEQSNEQLNNLYITRNIQFGDNKNQFSAVNFSPLNQTSYSASKLFGTSFPNEWRTLLCKEEENERQEALIQERIQIEQPEQYRRTEQPKLTFPLAIAHLEQNFNKNLSDDDGEEAVRKQIISLDLEESENDMQPNNNSKSVNLRVFKKKLNPNSQQFISFQQDSQQNQSLFKNQQTQNTIIQNELPFKKIDLSELQDKQSLNEPKLMPLSCKQFKDLYLSEKLIQTKSIMESIHQAQYYQQNQQFLQKQPSFCMDSPLTPITPTLPIDNSSQIIVQTTHNPFILEISQKRYTGFLKYFDPIKLYGFIVIDNENKEIFFHFQDVTHYLLTKEFLTSFRDGRIIKLSFNICLYRGKASVRRKAVNLQPLI